MAYIFNFLTSFEYLTIDFSTYYLLLATYYLIKKGLVK